MIDGFLLSLIERAYSVARFGSSIASAISKTAFGESKSAKGNLLSSVLILEG
jgi:hypothetical protein